MLGLVDTKSAVAELRELLITYVSHVRVNFERDTAYDELYFYNHSHSFDLLVRLNNEFDHI